MAFQYKTSRNGAQRNLTAVLINNSVTVAVGDCVKAYTNGYIDPGVAAAPIKGIVHAIVDKNSLPYVYGTHVAASANSGDLASVTTAADNTTTQKYWALVDTSLDSIYSVNSNGTIGTTVNSNLPGARIDVDSANTTYSRVLESTATRTVATAANFYIHGVDPADSARLLVSIALPEELTK